MKGVQCTAFGHVARRIGIRITTTMVRRHIIIGYIYIIIRLQTRSGELFISGPRYIVVVTVQKVDESYYVARETKGGPEMMRENDVRSIHAHDRTLIYIYVCVCVCVCVCVYWNREGRGESEKGVLRTLCVWTLATRDGRVSNFFSYHLFVHIVRTGRTCVLYIFIHTYCTLGALVTPICMCVYIGSQTS
jgi:hypothetical protein